MNVEPQTVMNLESRILLYQQRHRLTIPQIAELREFSGITIPQISDQPRMLVTMAKMAELIRLSKCFKTHNLEFIPIKGPLLSWRLHHDFTVRYTNDLDILVNKEELDRILEVFRELGYQFHYSEIPAGKNHLKLIQNIRQHHSVYHPQKRILVEIHWKLFVPELPCKVNLDGLIKHNTVQVTLHGETFNVFNKEFDVVFLIFHGAKHAWFRLKWLHDIYSYSLDNDVDWHRVIELSENFGSARLVYEALYLADQYWVLPTGVARLYQDNLLKRDAFALRYCIHSISETGVKPGLIAWLKYAYGLTRYGMTLFPTVRYKLALLRAWSYSDADMQIIRLPDKLTFLYFIIRPFHVVYSKWRPYHLLYQKKDDPA
jgi:hypothetical protein